MQEGLIPELSACLAVLVWILYTRLNCSLKDDDSEQEPRIHMSIT